MLNNFWEKFDLIQWLLENILWEFIFIPFALFIFYFFWSLKLSIFLLKNNRLGLGTGARKYLADRFIKIWYAKDGQLPYLEDKNRYSPQSGFLYAYFYNGVAEKILKEKKLVKIEVIADKNTNKQIVKPIKNIRNRLILWIIKFYLIHFMFDGKKYYRDIKK